MKNPKTVDPFDVPARIIPPGMTYQWVARLQFGKPDPTYQKMIDAGWRPVPFGRHGEHFSADYSGPSGNVEIGGQVLMEKPRTETTVSRDKEMDAACMAAGNGRTVAIDLTVRVKLSAAELSAAGASDLTGSQYASRRVQMIADGSDDIWLRGWDGVLMFERPPEPEHVPVRRVRHHAFQWLFDAISTED